MPGGFTGVDTFFVISGFLISGVIHREVASDTFTFARFYERRVRRIAPILMVVMFAALAMGLVLLLPSELEAMAKSALASLAMAPNVFFWRQYDYFALSGRITPLLHLWSLEVEEQF